VRAEIERLESQETRRDELQETINTLNEEHAEIRTLNKTLYAEMQAIKTRIATVEAAEAGVPPCAVSRWVRSTKTTLLADLQADGTARGDTYRANETRRKDIEKLDRGAPHRNGRNRGGTAPPERPARTGG